MAGSTPLGQLGVVLPAPIQYPCVFVLNGGCKGPDAECEPL